MDHGHSRPPAALALHEHEPLPVGSCFAVFFVLIALTAVTVGAAFLDLKFLSTPVALAIASAKALLVMLYFMELRHSPKLTWVIIGNGVFWLAVMISLVVADYVSRGWLGFPGK
jgi:cytochrome c oxidase subunit 4